MIPVLVVEGVALKVAEIRFNNGNPLIVTACENGSYKDYYDKSHEAYVEDMLKVDLKDSLFWTGRYDEPYKSIHMLIKEKKKELIDLSTEIANTLIEYPCAPPSLIEQYKKLQQRILGLIDARDIMDEFMMIEDVDLSGGDEVE